MGRDGQMDHRNFDWTTNDERANDKSPLEDAPA
jgi:hypothetical protein